MREQVETVEGFAGRADTWLSTVAELRSEAIGVGDDSVSIFPRWEGFDATALVGEARSWLRTRYDAGFSGISLPIEVGGLGLSAAHDAAYEMLESRYDLPPSELWNIGMHMVVPAIYRCGSDDQRERFVQPGLRGDLLFCQLFSEPAAGSDLAAVRTRAEWTGGRWSVTGQKVWTSAAQAANFGMALCRTGSVDDRNRGITCLLIPLDAPGVTIRPIRQATGGSAFNEVFLDDVEVDDSLRLGEINGGWVVAIATLGTERLSVPIRGPHGSPERIIELARRFGVASDPIVRHELVDLIVRRRIADLLLERAHERLRDGHDVGPLASILKLSATDLLTRLGEVAAQILGPRFIADTGEWGTWVWQRHALEALGLHIGGGTDEIQRNILAERSLGLPRDPRPGPAPGVHSTAGH